MYSIAALEQGRRADVGQGNYQYQDTIRRRRCIIYRGFPSVTQTMLKEFA